MQPALVSSTAEQRGITWGGTLADGLDGGTMPAAAALPGAPAPTTMPTAITAAVARTVRANDVDTARAPARSRPTLFAPS